MAVTRSRQTPKHLVVRNMGLITQYLLLFIVFSLWGLGRFIYGTGTDGIGGLVLALICYFLLTAQWSGIIIDLKDGTIQFPGGGIAADSVPDYVRPSWLFQHFLRFSQDLEDLQSVEGYSKVKLLRVGDYSNAYLVYKLRIVFTNMVVTTNFAGNSAKRDQIQILLMQVLKMGDPVLVR
jgi:TM2 domain-containing membrane protein YozV